MNEPVLLKAMEALEPVFDRLVVVGGTAHRLFSLHEYGDVLEHELLTTEDVDFAAPLELASGGGDDLIRRLQSVGFNEEVLGARYPTHRYRLSGTVATLQFLAPRTGSGRFRTGRRDRVLRFSGIVAEKLPNVDVLLASPWSLDARGPGFSGIKVVNPLAFLAQKLLILKERNAAKRGKDVLYLYDTLAIFSEHLDELRAYREGLDLTRNQLKTIGRSIKDFFGEVGGGVREAVRIAEQQRASPPSGEVLRRACYDGLSRLFLSG